MNPKIEKEYPLYPDGILQLSHIHIDGMWPVGNDRNPFMARILVPESCGLYPDKWFRLPKRMQEWKIMADIEQTKTYAKDPKDCKYSIPDYILMECYKQSWEDLYYENKLRESK